MIDFIRRLLRSQPHRYTAEQISILDTAYLRELMASDQCQSDAKLLVMVWTELRLREQSLRVLSEPTISIRSHSRCEDSPHREGGG